MVENKDAKQPEESSSLEGAIASSPEAISEAQEKVSEAATPQQAETPPVKEEAGETPLHEHPRFKEVVDEKNFFKQTVEKQQQQIDQLMARQQPQPTDPDAGKTPEEKVFWQQVRDESRKAVQPQLQAGITEIANLRATLFQREHPDVREGTPEYQQIVQKISQGYLPDDAYKSVMYDKKVGEKRVTNEQTQQQRLQAKKQANVVSSSSVSSQATPAPKETYQQEIERKIRETPIEDLMAE